MKQNMRIANEMDRNLLRDMCIDNNFYTRGNNEEYSEMLNRYHRKEVTAEDVYNTALDIYNHSDIDEYETTLEDVIFEVLHNAVRVTMIYE